ncbi:GNAT family N-acetyltransferase [Kitasatospora sp. NPDC050463]|uniref:GNAT family N-acetyltransferase n=1 Tax=Kitasatospora sp. NPDC050463 TaxID=3155786 RepID=UPI0033DF7BCB
MAEQPEPPGTLVTERLLLRPPQESDLDAIFEACQDEEIQRWTVVPSPYLRKDAEYFVNDLATNGRRTGDALVWCVVERSGGALVGTQGLVRTPGRPGCAEIGWWATREYRGRGFTVEAARAVARHGLTELGLRRLEWVAYVGNEGPRRPAPATVPARSGGRGRGRCRCRPLRSPT